MRNRDTSGVLPEDQMLDLVRTEHPTAGAKGWVWETQQCIVDRIGRENPGRIVTVIPRTAQRMMGEKTAQ